jgi:predicted PurR-regulated permease PerM
MTTRTRSSADTIAVVVLAVVAALLFLRYARLLLIPIALATLLSYALEPLVAQLDRWRVPRVAGATLVMLTLLGAIALGGYTLRDEARELVRAVPKAAETVRQRVTALVGLEPEALQQAGGPAGGSSGEGSGAQRIGSALFELSGQAVVVFFLTLFLLISGHHVRNRIVEVAGPDRDRQRLISTIIDDINDQIQRYLLVLLFTGAVVAVVTWAVLAWIGVENALMWGIFAGAFNSIPYFGPVIVCAGLFVVGLVQGGGVTQALQMSGAALVITSLEGWLLTPTLMGKMERMSSLAVFLGLLLWTWLWGGWGTLLAVPMLVVIKSVADRVERLKPVGRLMAP